MSSIGRIHHHAALHAHKLSAHAKEMLGAARGTFPTVILDDKLSKAVEKMRPSESAVESAKGGTAKLVYHFKTAAEAKAVYQSATELDAKTGKRYPSPSLGDNIAECLDHVDEVGDPKISVQGSNVIVTVQYKPAS